MSRIIATIEGEPVTLHPNGSVTFTAKAAIDTDGSGLLHGDPDAQRQTSLRVHGQSLNADVDRYIVVPPAIINGVGPVVLGCQAYVTDPRTGKSTPAVVGDVGPKTKLGEISRAAAMALGIDPSPTTGGEDAHVIEYTLLPGHAAIIEGKSYPLQPSA